MSLRDRLRTDLNHARRARDRDRVLVLSTIISDLRNQEINSGVELDDDGVLAVVTAGIKRRRASAEQARSLGRPERAETEEAQAELLAGYLPEAMGEAEVRALVRKVIGNGATAVGPVMGAVMPHIRGRFDGREANRIVREELAGG